MAPHFSQICQQALRPYIVPLKPLLLTFVKVNPSFLVESSKTKSSDNISLGYIC